MSGIATHLGQKSEYKKTYDPTLLVRELRQDNRTYLGLDGTSLPFQGFDIWNAYEVSAINDNGLPYSFVVKIVYPSSNPYIVESKSLKLYFNSFAMTKLGRSELDVKNALQKTAEQDLSTLLECKVEVGVFGQLEVANTYQNSVSHAYCLDDFKTLEFIEGAPEIVFEHYNEQPELLKVVDSPDYQEWYDYHSSSLVSCCKVTSQPDSGEIFISYRGVKTVTPESLLQYLVSFRNENHFHEEICEAVWKRLYDLLQPDELLVGCFYSRRGGIDINPVRWMGDSFTQEDQEVLNVKLPHIKLPRQ